MTRAIKKGHRYNAVRVTGTTFGLENNSSAVSHDYTVDLTAGTNGKAILTITGSDNGATNRTISSVTVDPGGLAIAATQIVADNEDTGENYLVAIYIVDIGGLSGTYTVRVTFSTNMDTSSLACIKVAGLRSVTETFKGSNKSTSATSIAVPNVTAEKGGITVGVGNSGRQVDVALGWTNLTERGEGYVSFGTSEGQRHNYGQAYDLQKLKLGATSVTFSGDGTADEIAAAVASFR